TQMIEGEKSFDVTLRWPARLRENETLILNIPVDISGNTVTPGSVASAAQTPISGPSTGVSSTGTSATLPSLVGSANNAPPSSSPRRRIRDLVTPLGDKGRPERGGSFTRPGASMIYREQGKRMIAVKFGVRGRDLAGTVAEAQEKTADLFHPPYWAVWSGEFE